ncbi:NAD(P)H-binding protein [Streptomyces sp. CS081A]|uniref:NmrA family NAD(P)-binding protein n=1 Tax=Streptomyces TaxID=1883 RepID=UPI0019502DC4|nr:NAD(P)H-binding protein [Streptomyces sp. CS081A]
MDLQVDLGDLPVDTSAPILVTGATGYVAGWIVKALLDAGATVHAAVRDPGDTAKVRHLAEAADASPGTLRLFASDLMREGSYREAMRGCRIVVHTASPFTRTVRDPGATSSTRPCTAPATCCAPRTTSRPSNAWCSPAPSPR